MAAEILTIGDKMDLHHIYSAMGGLLKNIYKPASGF